METITPESFARIVDGILADKKTGLLPRLYHYTSQEGLLGILSSKTLWATRIQSLNDSTEFAYTLALLKKAFDLQFQQPLTKLLTRSEEHTSELQSQFHLVCRLLLEKKKKKTNYIDIKKNKKKTTQQLQ